MKFLYIKEIYLQTKELISSQFLIAIIAVLQVSYVVKQLGVENFGMVTLIITLPSLIFRATHSRNSDVTLLALKKGSNVFTESIIFDFLIGLFSFSVCFLIFYSELGSYFGIKEITPVILLYLFSRIVQTFSETSKAILIFQGKMKSFSLLEFVTVLVRFLSILFLFSINAFWFALICGIISFLFLECINYIEHYGLKRFMTASGRYERVEAHHSWNSNHNIGRIVLYELTRHSDHHYKASKKYQILDSYDKSPQLPFGYPASILLSLVPPLWFYFINPLVPAKMKGE